MAIEFNCPHCAGSMRARDRETGQEIACARCARKVIVPALPVPAIEFLCPHCGATIRVRGTAIGSRGSCPACRGSVQVPAPGDTPVLSASIEVAPSSEDMDTVGASLKRRRKNRSIVYLVPLVLIIALGGMGIYLLLKPDPPLTGTLKAERVEAQELGPFIIDRTYCTVPDDQFDSVREVLTTSPLRARSQLLRIEFQGVPRGIEVSLHTGDETEFFRVDPARNERLRKFLVNHVEAYEERRRQTLKSAVPEFLHAIDRRRSESLNAERMLEFRNHVGLATAVRGFGFVVAARHRGTLYPCVHEDRHGVLYFAIPRRAREFELVGQELASKRDPTTFPGQFEVKVVPEKASGSTRPGKPEKREKPAESGDSEPEDDGP